MTKTILAADLRPGDQIVARDGALLDVETVTPSKTGKTITVTFRRGMWMIQPGPATVRASARVDLMA